MSSFMKWWFAAHTSTRFAEPDVSGFGRYAAASVGERVTSVLGFTSGARFDTYRSHICSRYGTQYTYALCTRQMSPQKTKKEEECVAEILAGGQIEPNHSPWSAPVVLVTKKDGGTRFCVDYRRLNIATVKDAYPLPRINDTLDMLAGKQWFSTLDLASGYWQVSLSQEARIKTVFATHSGLFQFKVMPFGKPGLCESMWLLKRQQRWFSTVKNPAGYPISSSIS